MKFNRQYTATKTVEDVVAECSAEHSLPDYKGDLKKILFTDARIRNDETYSDGERIEMNGSVEFSVVYLDADGEISHCEFVGDYETSWGCDREGFTCADVCAEVQSYNVRVIGPRKLAARAVVESTVTINEQREISVGGDAFELGTPEIYEKIASIQMATVAVTAEKEFNEQLEVVDGVIADEVEVLFCTAEGRITNLPDERGEIEGEITVSALISCRGEQPHIVKKNLPIDALVDIEPKEGFIRTKLLSQVKINELSTSVGATDDGATVNVTLKAVCKVSDLGNTTEGLIGDCFLTDRETECEMGEFKYTTLVGCDEAVVQISSKIDSESVGAEQVRNILLVGAKARVNEVKTDDEIAEISGEIKFSAIACEINGEGMPEYQNLRFEVPFTEKVKLSCQLSKDCRVIADVYAFEPDILLDQSYLYPSCKVYIMVKALCDKRDSVVVSSFAKGEPLTSDDSIVTVCYPSEDETLYDVAKRYHKTLLSIAADNSIAESVFSMKDAPVSSLGIKKILIR